MKNIRLFLWQLRFMFHAILLIRCSPFFAWEMATTNEQWFVEGYSPKEALWEELSYWDVDEATK